jgi:hypothetical protein
MRSVLRLASAVRDQYAHMAHTIIIANDSHQHDEMTQITLGLTGMFIVHPRQAGRWPHRRSPRTSGAMGSTPRGGRALKTTSARGVDQAE